MSRRKTKVVRYRTAGECFAAWLGCKPRQLPKSGYYMFYDRDGIGRKFSIKTCLRNIRDRGCWGWCQKNRVLHLWISSRASLRDAVGLVAHELGHCEPPHHRRPLEEVKAGRYERIACCTLDLLGEMGALKKKRPLR